MKKILSLFVLLMTIVIGAKADTTLFSYTTSSQDNTAGTYNATPTGCTFQVGVASKYESSKGIKLDGDSGTKYVKVNLASGETLKAGDVITIEEFASSNPGGSDYGVAIGTTAFTAIQNLYLPSGKKNVLTEVSYKVVANDGLAGQSSFYAFRCNGKSTYINAVTITRTVSKTVATQAFAGVKQGGVTLTENTDYTVDGTTITLTNSAIIAPEDISLINHITYTDASTEDVDVDITLEKDEAGDFFEGTTTIGLTTYTVQVPVSTAATLEADVTALTVSSPKVATGTAKFNVVGANLTGESVSLAFDSAVDGLTVSPASITITEGAVNQEVTVSYYSTEDVSETIANLTITSTGVDAITIPVTYSSTAGVTTITDVTDSYTWDWDGATSANIESPDANSVVVLSNTDGWASTFDAGALAGKAQYFSNSTNKCFQGHSLKFHTTLPGTIQVDFSNTGGSRPYRYLKVNGVVTEYKSASATKVSTGEIAVPAGDVELQGWIVDPTDPQERSGDVEGESMLRIYKVVFTADNGKEDSDLAVDPAETSVNMQETTDVTYTTSSTGAVTVESSDNTIATATVDATNKTITISGVTAGQATITVSQEADDNYNAGSKEITVTVINPNVKTVYDATGLTDDEFVLVKANIGGNYGDNTDNQFVTTSIDKWSGNKTYAGHTGEFFNMSTDRTITFKVKGAENFRVSVQNSNADRSYTVKVGEAAAQTVNHGATGVEYSDIFETGSTDEVTIEITGASSSVYPVTIQFNVQTSENIAFSDVTTYVTKHALDFTEVTELSAYAVTQIKTTSVATEKVGQVPAGTPLLIKADGAVNVDVPVIESAEAITNLLLASDGEVTADGSTIFAYSNKTFKFAKVKAGLNIPAGKAYLQITTPNAPTALDVDFDGATAVETIAEANEADAAAPVKVIKNGKLYIGNYNVAGQQVK